MTTVNNNSKSEEDFPRTELDGKYLWKCAECPFESFFMYKADTHQAETDHMFHKRVTIDELLTEIQNAKHVLKDNDKTNCKALISLGDDISDVLQQSIISRKLHALSQIQMEKEP